MKDKTPLINLLKKLAHSLEEANKVDTAKFFFNKANEISSASSDAELKGICQELSSSGVLSQYANFSYREDELFDLIYQRSIEMLSSENTENTGT